MNTGRLKSSLWLLAIGLWPALWLALPFWIAPTVANDMSEQFIADTYRGLFGAYLHLRTLDASSQTHAVLLFGATVTVVTIIVFVLGRLLVRQLDPSHYSSHAIVWSMRSIPCMLIWTFGIAIATGLLLMGFSFLFDGWLPLVAIIATFLLLVFIAQRPDIVKLDKPPLFWTPRWPGFAPMLITIAAWSISLLISAGEDVLDAVDWPSGAGAVVFIAAGLTGWLLNIYASAASLSAWQYGWTLRALTKLRRWRDPTTLRALAALDLRFVGVLTLVLLPPVIFGVAYFAFVLPQISIGTDALHQTRSFNTLLIECIRWVSDYWWLCLGWTVGVVFAAGARTIRLIERDAVVTAAEIQ